MSSGPSVSLDNSSDPCLEESTVCMCVCVCVCVHYFHLPEEGVKYSETGREMEEIF